MTTFTEPNYGISNSYLSMQGEGVHMGVAAFVIKFHGCDQKCAWCDAAETWHPKYKPPVVPRYTPSELLALAKQAGIRPGTIILLTGGEPSLYRLDPIIQLFRAAGYPSHIETAGHRPLPRAVPWITVSPKQKFGAPPLPENIRRANEFKIIVDSAEAIDEALELILPFAFEKAAIWLHPEWSRARDPDLLNLISERVKTNPRLRAGYQLQKIYRCDPELPMPAPLGGDPARGTAN